MEFDKSKKLNYKEPLIIFQKYYNFVLVSFPISVYLKSANIFGRVSKLEGVNQK